VLDYHAHLHRGPYTAEWLGEFLDAAGRAGVTELGVVEHFYLFEESRSILANDYIAGKGPRRLADFLDLIGHAKASGLPVKIGLEVDYVPHKEQELAAALAGLPLDFVIGSVHWLGEWGFDLDAASWEGRSVEAVYRRYYETLAGAAESGLFDVIGHPGNIGYFGHRPPTPVLEEVEGRFLDRARRLGVCLEVNTGGLLRPCGELFPRTPFLGRIVEAGLPVIISSDAHRPEEVGHAFPAAHALLGQLGAKETVGFNLRRRESVPLTAFPSH